MVPWCGHTQLTGRYKLPMLLWQTRFYGIVVDVSDCPGNIGGIQKPVPPTTRPYRLIWPEAILSELLGCPALQMGNEAFNHSRVPPNDDVNMVWHDGARQHAAACFRTDARKADGN